MLVLLLQLLVVLSILPACISYIDAINAKRDCWPEKSSNSFFFQALFYTILVYNL